MMAGATFLPDAGGSHLWVVLSDPERDANKVLIVSITTWRDGKEATCRIGRGAHGWVNHESCVDYGRAKIVTVEELYSGKDSGLLRFLDPVTPALLKHIRDCAASSPYLSEEAFDVLLEQGLARYDD